MVQVSWQTVMQAQCSGDVSPGAALSSLDWVLDGAGVAVMDSCGRLALMDIHGVTYSIQLAARPGRQPGQAVQARPLLAPASKRRKRASTLHHFNNGACMTTVTMNQVWNFLLAITTRWPFWERCKMAP